MTIADLSDMFEVQFVRFHCPAYMIAESKLFIVILLKDIGVDIAKGKGRSAGFSSATRSKNDF